MLSWEISYRAPAPLTPVAASSGSRRGRLILSIRQGVTLHRLLHRDLGKCTGSQLDACQRSAWSSGAGGGHELTAEGRRIAELSEQSPPEREIGLGL